MTSKYELDSADGRIPDNDLLADLQRVAEIIGKNTVTRTTYQQHGHHDRGTISRRFGSWSNALSRAGLSTSHLTPITDEELIADLLRVATLIDKRYVTRPEYEKHGKWSMMPYNDRFGNWTTALERAGLGTSPQFNKRLSLEQLFKNLENVWASLGRQPRGVEIEKPLSAYALDTYEHRFGSWRKALEAFVEYANDSKTSQCSTSPDPITAQSVECVIVQQSSKPLHRTPRKPGHKLRFLVLKRDHFKCRACGLCPATTSGVELHVDHITPWEKGGETEFSNLQTLCSTCNLGKSNLL